MHIEHHYWNSPHLGRDMALTVYGHIHFERTDYEPALRAFEEAHHILSEILNTIDSESEQRSYISNIHANKLNDMRHRILELVG